MIVRQIVLFGALAAATFGQRAAAEEKEPAKAAAAQAGRAEAENGAVWSQPVNGLQARIELKHAMIFNGTPIIATTLYLRNATDLANAMKVPWARARMTFRVVDAAGKDLPIGHKGMVIYDGMEATPLDLVLPFKGTLSFDISHHGLGVSGDQVALIDLGFHACWVLSKEDGACSLHAVLEIAETKASGPPTREWFGRIELPPVPIPTSVPPRDPAVTDDMIRQWGRNLVAGNDHESRQAAKELAWLIDNARVIPWYVKAIETEDFELKRDALDRLSRFKGDEALAGLKKGMTTQAADISRLTSDAKQRRELAEDVRHAAAIALVRSPHPDAKRLLLTMWNDPALGVRVTVLHALGEMKTEESLALLRRMTEDPDKIVHDEAQRYLKLRTADAGQAGERR